MSALSVKVREKRQLIGPRLREPIEEVGDIVS